MDITILDDAVLEAAEEFFVFVTTSAPRVFIDTDETTVRVTDADDGRYSYICMYLCIIVVYCNSEVSSPFLVGVTVGLEQTEFTVDEGDVVEVCAILINGALEREVTVTLHTRDGTATSGGI